ncbi:MAG: hypothetical protein G4V63_27640, partial [Candidatus Afipia apatlaquensis]|nr:hypothetical protein [Candidatus Afipia apatlaquensis]
PIVGSQYSSRKVFCSRDETDEGVGQKIWNALTALPRAGSHDLIQNGAGRPETANFVPANVNGSVTRETGLSHQQELVSLLAGKMIGAADQSQSD